jgi:hypothetical protein
MKYSINMRSWCAFRYYSTVCLEGPGKPWKILSQDSQLEKTFSRVTTSLQREFKALAIQFPIYSNMSKPYLQSEQPMGDQLRRHS